MSSLERLRSGLMSFQPLPKVLSQSVAVAGIARVSKASGALPQASGTIILVSRVSGPKGSLKTLSLSEPCIVHSQYVPLASSNSPVPLLQFVQLVPRQMLEAVVRPIVQLVYGSAYVKVGDLALA
jgi:hypothetical protein